MREVGCRGRAGHLSRGKVRKPAAAGLRQTPHRACRSSRAGHAVTRPGNSGTTVALRQIDDPVQSGGTRTVGRSCPPDLNEGTYQSVVGLIRGRTPRAQEREKQRCHEVVQLGQCFDAPVCDLHQQVISTCCRPSGDEARCILRMVAIRMVLPDPGLRILHVSYPIGAPAPGFRVGDRLGLPASGHRQGSRAAAGRMVLCGGRLGCARSTPAPSPLREPRRQRRSERRIRHLLLPPDADQPRRRSGPVPADIGLCAVSSARLIRE